MGRIMVGTASWTDNSLIGSGWYPTGVTSAEDRLGFYASRFPLVEVDSTYYFLPRREVAKRWVERTPAKFTFDIKAFSLLTQHPTRAEALPPGLRPAGKPRVYLRHLDDPAVDEVWSRFLSALGPLRKAGKLGAVLFQFPPWFTIKRANKEYLAECAERARSLQVCVEFRSPTWLSGANRDETMELLAKHNLAYVCVDTARRKGSVPAVPAATSSELAVVRFHGRARRRTDASDDAQPEAAYLYTKQALESWVPKLEALAGEAKAVHAVFRNVHRDYAPRSAERLAGLLQDSRRLVKRWA
jgi:uncharacterized protein YecE (DUF72 family)